MDSTAGEVGATAAISIDHASAAPPYEQVRVQFAGRIGAGSLPAGTRLPTVRRLADELGLAVNTVARAYRELEAAGLVATHGRGGTIVTASGAKVHEQLQHDARDYAARAKALGVADRDALGLVQAALTAQRPADQVR